MDSIYAIILGIVQGLTEFCPISSSGHLVIAHEILDFNFVDDLSFDVALHLGTLVSLVIFFWKDIVKFIVAFFRSFANWNLSGDINQRLAWFVAVGTVPAAVVGYFIADLAESVFRNLWLISALLIVGAGFFFIIERISKKNKELTELTWGGAIIVAFAQVLALVPGVSRSGSTIIAGMFLGLKRHVAARFSFLLSIPVVFGAGVKKMIDVSNIGLSSNEWVTVLIGFVSAAIVGYFAIAVLLRFLERRSLNIFGYYRLLLGVIIMIFLIVR